MNAMQSNHLVAAAELDGRCDPLSLPFESTDTVAPLQAVFGQERAARAISFALGMRDAGYHLYAAGPDGLGKTAIVQTLLGQRAAEMKPVAEWVLVRNFAEPDRPRAMSLPRGEAVPFADAMRTAVQRAVAEVRAAFQSDSYAKQRQTLAHRTDELRGELLRTLHDQAEKLGFLTEFTPQGIATVPLLDGQPISGEQFAALPEERRHAIQASGEQLEQILPDVLLQLRTLERTAQEQIEQLDREVATAAIERHIQPIEEQWADAAQPIRDFVLAVRHDLVEHRERFLHVEEANAPWAPSPMQREASFLRQYQVNVLTGPGSGSGAPVVFESNPTYYNLVGRIEYVAQFGTMSTDHMMIKPGSLLRANGGFLIVRARDLLSNPAAYQGVKRALNQHAVTIENLDEVFGMVPTAGLRPEPIPLDVQVVIVGDRELQAVLYRLDPDFRELFRVSADFDSEFERTAENIAGLASLVRDQCDRHGLLGFSREAVAALVQYSSRAAEDQRRLSADMGSFVDILRQANFWAREAGAPRVEAEHVRRALDEQVYRSAFIRDRLREAITDGSIRLETAGEVIGQVNALSVVGMGGVAFGQPSRITCVTSAGTGNLVAVEHETHVAGPIHDKGFLTARGFLADRFGKDRAMAFDASLAFEQLYGGIEGDSASSSELYALLSSLAQVPVRQSVAVTGSVDQRGEVQSIGGATTKIEGFFEVCSARGLDGTQGVIIPATNIPNVILRPDVIDAITAGRFHVWAVDRIEDGIALLTGLEAGTRDAGGRYPDGSVFRLIEDRLDAYALRAAGRAPGATREVLVAAAPSAPAPLPPGVPPSPPPEPPVRMCPLSH